MARGVNKVILIGHLGSDPDVRFKPNGDAVANFSVATSEAWKDKETGEAKERTEWHRIVCFRKLAEICKQYLRKGSKVYIEGKIYTEKWLHKETGQDMYATKIHCDSLQMLGDSNKSAEREGANSQPPIDAQQHIPQAGNFDDDIPF